MSERKCTSIAAREDPLHIGSDHGVDGATSNLLYFFLRLEQVELKVFRFVQEHDLIETT